MRFAWLVALVLLPSLLVGAPAAAQPAAPAAIAPDAAAWFDAGYPDATAPQPPPPPGVDEGQLLVEGATVAVGVVPAPLPVAPVVLEKALTALSFRIPAGTTPATLVLDLVPGTSTAQATGRAPTGVTPQACPATGTFDTGGQQPFDALPAYDCTGRTSVGALSSDGTQLVFADIGGLTVGSVLSVVLRPGTLGPERLVIDLPSKAALTLLPFDAAPLFDHGGAPAEPTPAAPSGGAPPAAPVTMPASPDAGAFGEPRATPGAPADAAPVVAPDSGAGSAAPVAAVVPAASPSVDDSAARIAALAGLLLVTVTVGWLAMTDPRQTTSRAEPEQWGYGAHRSVRSGPTPAL